MEEQFDLPVSYNGQEHTFKASLIVFGYSHKFHVYLNGQTVVFEPDEERNYRAVINYEDRDNDKDVDVVLLKKIAETIAEIVK